jgi:hypothetical protein
MDKSYAFIKGTDVVNTAMFDEPSDELIELFKQEHGVDQIILADEHTIIGGTYINEHFVYIKPYNSWILNEETYEWEAPVAYPTDGKQYDWDEENLRWVEFVIPID